jgi:hypothetical protein
VKTPRRIFCSTLLLFWFEVAGAQDPCAGFNWDVKHELALFAAQAHSLAGGRTRESAPRLMADQLYELSLAPDPQVTFVAPPGRKNAKEDSHAGLVRFEIRQAGLYRVSVDQQAWVDVIAAGKVIGSKDFQGRRGCSAPHKVVEFDLPASRDLVLQLSNASDRARITLTRAP